MAVEINGQAQKLTLRNLGMPWGAWLIGYIEAGSGSLLRRLMDRLREKVSVKSYGATGDGIADDLARCQACIDANPGKVIVFPAGTYKFLGRLRITSEGTELRGAGLSKTYIIQYTADVDTILFEPTTAGSSTAMLGSVGIEGIHVYHATSVSSTNPSAGAGIRFRQCSRFRLFSCWVQDAVEGVTVEGGQLGSIKTLRGSVSSSGAGAYLGVETSLLHFKQAPVNGGFYQPCYTMEVDDFHLTGALLRGSCIRVANCDGLNFGNGYCSGGFDSIVRVKADRETGADGSTYSYVSALSFVNSYLDCVGVGWTKNGVVIASDGFTNTSVNDITIGSGCTIGNGDESGIVCRKAQTSSIVVSGAKVINMTKWAADIEGGSSRTDLIWSGGYVSNCGNGSSGGIRLSTGLGLALSGVTFRAMETTVLKFEGTIDRVSISGCANHSNVADITNSGTVSTTVFAGNGSAWSGSLSNSWTGFSPSVTIDGQTFNGQSNIRLKKYVGIGGSNQIDPSTSTFFSKTISGATTFSVTNVPSAGNHVDFTLELVNGGSAVVTWWAGVKWASGVAPTLTAAGTDVLTFSTRDGGTTWYGRVEGLAFA